MKLVLEIRKASLYVFRASLTDVNGICLYPDLAGL